MVIRRLQHIFLREYYETSNYTSPLMIPNKKLRIPNRNPQSHSAHLFNKFKQAWKEAESENAIIYSDNDRRGYYIEFMSDPDADLVTKSLEDLQSKKVRLLNVRTEKKEGQVVTFATVYIDREKIHLFLNKIEAYATQKTDKGRPKHFSLINSISDIRKAFLIEAFWQDDKELIPFEKKEWCEVWLSSDTEEVRHRFEKLLEKEGIVYSKGFIRFPERTVKVILANKKDLEKLSQLSDDIAEYRKAKDTTAFWLDMENEEQVEWIQELLNRIQVDDNSNVSLCILDTGVNNGHPLIAPVLKQEDCQSVNIDWGENDHNGHGTLMAGIATYEDLNRCLANKEIIYLKYFLESIKILPPPPNENQQELWGYITWQGVSRAEINAPHNKRVLCLAVTATDTRDKGRPSSWSGQLDKLASGAENENDIKRLFIVSAGNVIDLELALNYPDAQMTDSVHDPAQAWNVLTVGAYTELEDIRDSTFEGFAPIASSGQLSPFTTTSFTWEDKWPNKPDIVMEGGNLAHDGQGMFDECDDLSILSTYYKPMIRHLGSHNMTSAATAKAACFASQIQCAYPNIWPETIRALIVHSAEWTEALKAQFLKDESKSSYATLLRICGYGVPNIEQAIYSASNSLTLIAEEYIQPYDKKEDGNGYKTKEMHFYDLPWPKEALHSLQDEEQVQMRVTLSYFPEPGPGEIGWKDRYRYASYALRFDVKSPNEDKDEFLKRINKAVRSDEEGHPGTDSSSSHWLIGKNGRNKGSVHSDIWQGTAAELADSDVIAVYPIIGWWRERAHLGCWNCKGRYSLIVSIKTSSEEIDVYTPVANKLGITLPIDIET